MTWSNYTVGTMKWISCCNDDITVALKNNKMHIWSGFRKDNYGNYIVVDKDKLSFSQEPEDIPEDPLDFANHMVRIYGQEPQKPPVQMTIFQFYQLLSTIEKLQGAPK